MQWAQTALQWALTALLWAQTALQWAQTELLWAQTALLWAQTELLWAQTALLWAQTELLWAHLACNQAGLRPRHMQLCDSPTTRKRRASTRGMPRSFVLFDQPFQRDRFCRPTVEVERAHVAREFVLCCRLVFDEED